jgi:hypothetical protein
MIVRSPSVAPAVGIAPDPADPRPAGRIHAHLTTLPGLLAEQGLAEVHVEGRDRRTGALVAYSFVTIHRTLALHVAEAVRVALARLEMEARPESGPGERAPGDRERSDAESPDAVQGPPQNRRDLPGQYL